jgi:hypothetical protein
LEINGNDRRKETSKKKKLRGEVKREKEGGLSEV